MGHVITGSNLQVQDRTQSETGNDTEVLCADSIPRVTRQQGNESGVEGEGGLLEPEIVDLELLGNLLFASGDRRLVRLIPGSARSRRHLSGGDEP
jgi:hypothetical protein